MTDAVDAYEQGRKCGLYGPDEVNCQFSLFSCSEKTEAWEIGKREGEKEKAKNAVGV